MHMQTHLQAHTDLRQRCGSGTHAHKFMHAHIHVQAHTHAHSHMRKHQKSGAPFHTYLRSAVELRHCVRLKEVNLENNRIATLVLDLRPLKDSLHSLQVCAGPATAEELG